MNVFIFEHQETKEILEINAETMREATISLLRILENERKIKWSDVLIDRFEEWIPVDVRKG